MFMFSGLVLRGQIIDYKKLMRVKIHEGICTFSLNGYQVVDRFVEPATLIKIETRLFGQPISSEIFLSTIPFS